MFMFTKQKVENHDVQKNMKLLQIFMHSHEGKHILFVQYTLLYIVGKLCLKV